MQDQEYKLLIFHINYHHELRPEIDRIKTGNRFLTFRYKISPKAIGLFWVFLVKIVSTLIKIHFSLYLINSSMKVKHYFNGPLNFTMKTLTNFIIKMIHIYDPLKHYSFSRKVLLNRLNILKSRSVNIKKSLKSKKLDHQNWHEKNAK